jgi:hypothetical protein
LRWLWAKLLPVLNSITKVKANSLDMIEPSVPSVVFETGYLVYAEYPSGLLNYFLISLKKHHGRINYGVLA